MNDDSPGYFEQRERAERAAAKKATSPQARRAHQELAQRYAALAKQQSPPIWVEGDPRPRLTVVPRHAS
jgi:hypothetical protein